MTTAHRATFHAAIGGKEQGGGRYIAGVTRVHVHDLAGQMSVKTRYTRVAHLQPSPAASLRCGGAPHPARRTTPHPLCLAEYRGRAPRMRSRARICARSCRSARPST